MLPSTIENLLFCQVVNPAYVDDPQRLDPDLGPGIITFPGYCPEPCKSIDPNAPNDDEAQSQWTHNNHGYYCKDALCAPDLIYAEYRPTVSCTLSSPPIAHIPAGSGQRRQSVHSKQLLHFF